MRISPATAATALLTLTLTGSAYAAESSPSVALDLFKVVGGLIVVLVAMAGSAWLLKRVGIAKVAGSQTIKVIGGVSVGGRERVMVLEVGDQWVVVGVAPGRVNAITTMPRQNHATPVTDSVAASTNFAAWLKQTLEKRNAN